MTTEKEHVQCRQPDRDMPTMECGYPMPCPWHTVIISEKGRVILPEQVPHTEALSKVFAVASAIKEINQEAKSNE